MEYAFWDSSSIVPLCVQEPATANARTLARKYGITVWWATPIEVRSAFGRSFRNGQVSSNGRVQAVVALEDLRRTWREILPDIQIRQRAEEIVERFPLTAADALQVGAAWICCSGHPRNRVFISGDRRLLEVVGQLGFTIVET